jgi:hypothetical protein
MEAPAEQQPQAAPRKKMAKQLTGKREDTILHTAAREGNLPTVMEILGGTGEAELKELLAKQNQAGETALYVAAEYGYVDLVREMIKYYGLADAGIKARNGFDALHIAAKQGDMGMYSLIDFVVFDCFSQMKLSSVLSCCRGVEGSNGGPSGIVYDRGYIKHNGFAHSCNARAHRDSELFVGGRKRPGNHC